ncbi:MAG: AraC family transcriptional regulator [Endozoicomonas sp.]
MTDVLKHQTDGSVLLSTLANAVRSLSAQGLSVHALLQGTGIEPGQLNIDRSNRQLVPFSTLMKIYDHAVLSSPHRDLGLRLGVASDHSFYGVLGYIMLSAATAIDAINLALRYQKIILGSLLTLSLHVERGAGIVRLNHCPGKTPGEVLYIEQLFSGFLQFNNVMTGKVAEMNEVRLSYPDPGYRTSYEHIFKCPVHFDAAYNEMVFGTDILGAPLPNADPMVLEACLAISEKLVTAFDEESSFASQIASLLQKYWETKPDMQDIASLLDCDVRTVRRKLKTEGTSFRNIKDQVRQKIAISELKNTSKTIQEIARKVGYAEAGNFRRAFMKWTGRHPGFYRN